MYVYAFVCVCSCVYVCIMYLLKTRSIKPFVYKILTKGGSYFVNLVSSKSYSSTGVLVPFRCPQFSFYFRRLFSPLFLILGPTELP